MPLSDEEDAYRLVHRDGREVILAPLDSTEWLVNRIDRPDGHSAAIYIPRSRPAATAASVVIEISPNDPDEDGKAVERLAAELEEELSYGVGETTLSNDLVSRSTGFIDGCPAVFQEDAKVMKAPSVKIHCFGGAILVGPTKLKISSQSPNRNVAEQHFNTFISRMTIKDSLPSSKEPG
jgi:hypothetical protein